MNKFVDWLYRGFQTTEQMKCGNVATETKEYYRLIKMLNYSSSSIEYMPTIYHYCSVESFFSIIKSKTMWLSSAHNLNDYQEMSWLKNKLKERLLKETINKELLHLFFEGMELAEDTPYICSFSKNGDILSQWRAYANDGTGIAIGFNSNAFGLKKTDIPNNNIFFIHSTSLAEVVYDEKEQQSIIDSISSKTIQTINNNTDGDFEYFIELTNEINKISYFCKNPAFSEEQEVRAIYSPPQLMSNIISELSNGIVSNVKYRTSLNNITPYVEIKFPLDNAVNPILNIFLGPKCRIDERDMIGFLRSEGYHDFIINKSSASYR